MDTRHEALAMNYRRTLFDPGTNRPSNRGWFVLDEEGAIWDVIGERTIVEGDTP